MGRRKKGMEVKIDWVQMDKLCALQCTKREIASWFVCSGDALERAFRAKGTTYTEYFTEKSAAGLISLRRLQYQKAEKGNPALLIWLGKQWLGQSDKKQIEAQVSATVTDKLTDEELANKALEAAKVLLPDKMAELH